MLTSQGQAVQHAGDVTLDTACDEVEFYLNGVLTAATGPNVSAEAIHSLIEALRNVLESQSKLFTAFLGKTMG